MLSYILRCFQFVEFVAIGIWKVLTHLGYFAVIILTQVTSICVEIFIGIAILGEEFRRFVCTLKQAVDDQILIFRLYGNGIVEFLIELFRRFFKGIEKIVPTKKGLEGTSKGLIDLLLRSVYLIADTAWWLVTLLPRTILNLFVALADFCVFSLDTARQCFCYFIKALVNDTMRTTVGLLVILIIFRKWRNIIRMVNLIRQNITNRVHNLFIRRRSRSTTTHIFPQRSIRRSPRRSLSPTADSKLLDNQRCVVCRTRGKCVLLWPCRHLCLCDECADVLSQRYVNICPLCRTDVELTISVYM